MIVFDKFQIYGITKKRLFFKILKNSKKFLNLPQNQEVM
ncbi:Hypothetical protein Ccan_09790 [Capnocytophaga canimorsus Cc5]|uniref:Uncharacterized protein n=1 Tax=Capnocytophaga canimorsus (strain 5) TaxID=860228 RepID=F9YUX2_CAPCC|nr:Hypothetical protein Ccan_09790 [Capnocytophaga canimorsus Cc5]